MLLRLFGGVWSIYTEKMLVFWLAVGLFLEGKVANGRDC